MLVHVLYSGSGGGGGCFCGFFFPLIKFKCLYCTCGLERLEKAVTCQHHIDLVLNEEDAWALRHGVLRVLCSISSMLGGGGTEPSQAYLWP